MLGGPSISSDISWRSLGPFASLRPGLAVVGGSHGVVEIGGGALDDGGIADRRLVDDGDTRYEPVLDFDMHGHEILEDDGAPGWIATWRSSLVGVMGGAAEAAPPE